jgi:hypothetical protein
MGDLTGKIGSTIDDGSLILLSVGSASYREVIRSIASFAVERSTRVCYVTLNDPYENISARLGEAAARMYFVDCVTSTIKPPKHVDGVSFVSSPRAFTEISIALKKAMKEEQADFAIFDSVSALMVYETSVSVLKFLHSIILACREGKMGCVFVMLKEDVDASTLKDLTMFVDDVVEVG